jgi:hypothetical protein
VGQVRTALDTVQDRAEGSGMQRPNLVFPPSPAAGILITVLQRAQDGHA